MSAAFDTCHFKRLRLNAVAPVNIADICVALDTSHFEMSPLNDVESANMLDMSMMLETSHSSIGSSAQFATKGRFRFVVGFNFYA